MLNKTLENGKMKVTFIACRPIISSQFAGPAFHSVKGDFWHTMPEVNSRLQDALLRKGAKPKKYRLIYIIDYLYTPK